MGKVDQGFFVLWAARHRYGGPLGYSGFGGNGYQVRDVLHVADFCELIRTQIGAFDTHLGKTYNVGGGAEVSVSLAELTELCAERTGRRIELSSDAATRAADIPFYVTDATRVKEATGWSPKRSVSMILEEVLEWLDKERATLEPILG
jgi:CDP-paratose 2-epimerase